MYHLHFNNISYIKRKSEGVQGSVLDVKLIKSIIYLSYIYIYCITRVYQKKKGFLKVDVDVCVRLQLVLGHFWLP